MEAIKLSAEEMQLIETFHQVHPEVPSALLLEFVCSLKEAGHGFYGEYK